MPELPEVEVARVNLMRWSRGQRVDEVRVLDPLAVRPKLSTRPSDGGDEGLRGASGHAQDPVRRGKRIGWAFGDVALLMHLGMTGKLLRRPAAEAPPRHARVGFRVGEWAVWFVDARRFGCVVPVDPARLVTRLSEGLGPDATDAWWTAERLAAALAGRRALKVALLDQRRIAGLGNIHAAEALFRAGVHPHATAQRLAHADWERLLRAIQEQLREALSITQAEEVVYLTDGLSNPFQVYGRLGQPCLRCGAPIVGDRAGGRATTWCPRCQPAPTGRLRGG